VVVAALVLVTGACHAPQEAVGKLLVHRYLQES
jgi:hypothetical protein